jgi:hypothetical protein
LSLIENADPSVVLDNEFHRRTWRGVVYRVFCEISDRTAQHLWIALHPNRPCCAQERNVLALRERKRRNELRDFSRN